MSSTSATGSIVDIVSNNPVAMEIYPDWDRQVNVTTYFEVDTACKEKESILYEDTLTEAFNMFGVDAYWYEVDYSLNNEKIFGEDNAKTIQRKFPIKYYVDSLPVDTKMFTQYGIEGMDVLHVYVSKKHFWEASQYDIYGNRNQEIYEPHQGDILWSQHNSTYYTVIEVKSQIEQFLQRRHTWDITIIPMKNEKIGISSTLSYDDINNYVNTPDILAQNNIVNTEKEDVLYRGPTNIDPFGLF